MSNENLRKARQIKNDEFYTQYKDIEAELSHYKDQLRGKIIYCNCDTPQSNFVKFLKCVQDEWGIIDVWHTSLEEGISFDSPQAKEMLAKCDIIITNPPFSLTRERFMPLLVESEKQFLFIGNLNMATYKEIFPLIRDGKLWTGYTHPKQFMQSDGTFKKFGNTLWWTNLDVIKPFSLNPEKKYYGNEAKYPHYDNYDAINVDRLVDIPSDYYGVMGVPVTFIEHYTPPRSSDSKLLSLISLDSAEEQMGKTSEQTEGTIICDILCPFDYKKNLYSSVGGGRTTTENVLPANTCSTSLDTNTILTTEQISNNLNVAAKQFINGFLLIGVDESCGVGLGGGLRMKNTIDHALINGKRKFTRLFIKYLVSPII